MTKIIIGVLLFTYLCVESKGQDTQLQGGYSLTREEGVAKLEEFVEKKIPSVLTFNFHIEGSDVLPKRPAMVLEKSKEFKSLFKKMGLAHLAENPEGFIAELAKETTYYVFNKKGSLMGTFTNLELARKRGGFTPKNFTSTIREILRSKSKGLKYYEESYLRKPSLQRLGALEKAYESMPDQLLRLSNFLKKSLSKVEKASLKDFVEISAINAQTKVLKRGLLKSYVKNSNQIRLMSSSERLLEKAKDKESAERLISAYIMGSKVVYNVKKMWKEKWKQIKKENFKHKRIYRNALATSLEDLNKYSKNDTYKVLEFYALTGQHKEFLKYFESNKIEFKKGRDWVSGWIREAKEQVVRSAE